MFIFSDHKGVISQHDISPKATVNGDYHDSVLKNLRQIILTNVMNWYGISHFITIMLERMSVLLLRNILENKVLVIQHSLFLTDFAPCDFRYFLTLQQKLGSRIFNSDSEIFYAQQDSLQQLLEKCFSNCFKKWDRCTI